MNFAFANNEKTANLYISDLLYKQPSISFKTASQNIREENLFKIFEQILWKVRNNENRAKQVVTGWSKLAQNHTRPNVFFS